MQHNNNNNAIANELNSIIISLADIKTESIIESLEVVESKISYLEHLSQKLDIPELRALTHWMMLNTELDDNNGAQISTLIEDGSYYNWMKILSLLLQDYNQTLLPVIYKTLTEPKWIVKPSAPLLRNLASWIEKAKVSAKKHKDTLTDKELVTTGIDENTDDAIAEENTAIKGKIVENQEFLTEIKFSDELVFEEIESTILEKNYADTGILKHFSDKTEDKQEEEFITEETSNYYDEIEEEKIIDSTEEIFSDIHDNTSNKEEKVEAKKEDNLGLNESIIDSTEGTANDITLIDDEADDFSIEVDDIIMSLATVSAESENILDNIEAYTAELQRFDMLAEISGYEKLVPISNWCQQNLSLFSKNKSDDLQQFVETGECWTWIELVKFAISDPDEISTISELNTELNRSEWLEPLAAKDLQSLLLFLHNPQNNTGNTTDETIVLESTIVDIEENSDTSSSDTPEFSFKWDEDVHPELLEVYFEETNENITDISAYLREIGSVETTKEQRQDARRTAHTIKGGSAVVGITALSTYAYQLEKILDYSIEHTLPGETNELLHTAATGVQDLYKAITEKKPSPEGFSKTLSKLTLCAETLEALDDEPLELSAPVLPDFITQQNIKNNAASKEKIEDDATTGEDIINNENSSTVEDLIEDKQEMATIDIENVIIENIDMNSKAVESVTEIETQKDTTEDIAETLTESTADENIANIEESVLPTLNQSDDLSDFTEELDDIVMTLITTEVQLETKPFKLDAYTNELQRLDMLAEISGYPEIVTISNWYQNNLKLIAEEGTEELSEFISSGESWTWIELISASLADPDDISHLSELSAELTRSEWIDNLDIEALQDVLLVLRKSDDNSVYTENHEQEDILGQESSILEKEMLETNDNVDNFSNSSDEKEAKIITWDDDVHPELLSVYLQETSEQVTKIAELLLLISKDKADKEQQEHAARIAHTIKGASGVVGITEIVDFTHNLEDILDYAVNNEIPEETAELLAESSDCLESLFEAVQDKTAAPEEFEPVLAKLIAYAETIKSDVASLEESPIELEMPELPDFINKPEAKPIAEDDTANSNIDTEVTIDEALENNEENTVEVNNIEENIAEEKNIDKGIDEEKDSVDSEVEEVTNTKTEESIEEITQEIAEISNKPSNEPKPVQTAQASALKSNSAPVTESHIRIPTSLINKLLNLAGELVTTSSQVSDKVEKTLETSIQIKEQDKRVHDMLDELSSTIFKQEKDQITLLSSMQNKDFDTLEMDTYNELHSVAGLLTESILDSETIESTLKNQLHEIHDDLRLLDNLNKELSETILNSRMESLNTLIPRLERIVRQTCRKTGKEAELVVTGNDINIDTEILSGLVDPLLHLLRNAIDHGIEDPSARESKKKKQSGQIQLNFSRQGNFIHMQLKDDGAGIDSEKIYQHAINKGLITPEQEFSKSEVLKLILEPGFSTQTSVTDISGRGVGMDVVNKGIEALKGSLTINSELGEGSTFNVKIPLTLVTSSTLLVETAGNKVAIPTDTIEQLYYLSPEEVLDRDDDKFIRHEGKELAIESLAGILGWTANDVDFSKAQTLLLVKGSQRLHAVYIDKIIHSREVVIKSLAHFIDGTKGVIGACHLSDGEVAPVMNLPQLLSINEQLSYTIKHLDESDIEVSISNTIPQILVVDDSLSNRKALSLIIDKTEYDVVTAVDGLDALNVMNEKHIDLVFTDLEMPRMTGLELTQAIRAWDEKKHIPIVMVTSRSTNKHRELATKAGVDDYLTKPVGTDTLLESIETWLNQTVEA